jgi:hypothetical protein
MLCEFGAGLCCVHIPVQGYPYPKVGLVKLIFEGVGSWDEIGITPCQCAVFECDCQLSFFHTLQLIGSKVRNAKVFRFKNCFETCSRVIPLRVILSARTWYQKCRFFQIGLSMQFLCCTVVACCMLMIKSFVT